MSTATNRWYGAQWFGTECANNEFYVYEMHQENGNNDGWQSDRLTEILSISITVCGYIS